MYFRKQQIRCSCILWFLIAAFLVAAPANTALAQLLTTDKSDSTKTTPAWPEDSLGRRTPRGTVEGFIQAVADENYTRAAHYLNIDRTVKWKKKDRPKLAIALQSVLDRKGNILPYSRISKDPEGFTDDDLGPTLDKIGEARIDGESFSLILEKKEDKSGAPVWLFSSQTIRRIAQQAHEEEIETPVDKLTPAVLENNKWGGVPVSHWLAMLVLAAVAYFISHILSKAFLSLIPKVWKKAETEPTAGILKAFAVPIRIYLAVWLFVAASQQIGISIIIRQQFSTITFGVGVAALLLLVWRLFNTSTLVVERRLTHRNNMAGVSAILFLRRIAKVAMIVIGVLFILDSFGFDVTTGIAALGIGGLALALGAQKTVENFVGSVTLIADQPVRVGDYCRVGDTSGTVEQIGMRSTRIRTLDRTIVTIPNGEFSSERIENYAHRDRFKLLLNLGLRLETTPDQIRYLLVELRSILYAHPKVDPEPARVRFKSINTSSLDLEVFGYLHAKDYSEFLEIQEDIMLRMMDVILASGTGIAIPSQTLYLARDKGVSKEKTMQAEEKVHDWREKEEMQLPRFTAEKIESLKETLPYPPEGSAIPREEQPTLF